MGTLLRTPSAPRFVVDYENNWALENISRGALLSHVLAVCEVVVLTLHRTYIGQEIRYIG